MTQNRLEILLAARTEQFTSALNRLRNDTRSAASGISQALESAGDGAEVVERALRGVDDAFGRSEGEGRAALDNLADASSEAGRELREAFQKSGKSISEAEKEAQEFVSSISKFANAKRDAEALTEEFKDLEGQLRNVDSAANAINFQTALDSAQDLTDGLNEVTGKIGEVAEESRNMERAIRLAIRKPETADELVKAAQDLKDEFGDLVSEEDIGAAIQRMDTLGITGVENFRRIAKGAIDSKKDLEDVADTLGEVLAPLDSGVFDAGVFDGELRTSLGIGGRELEKFGAIVDAEGKVVARYRDEQLKAQEALKRFLDESDRYADLATRNKDAQAQFTDEIEKFQRSVGEQVNELQNLVAETLLPLARILNDMPAGAKVAAAGFAVLIGPIAKLALIGGKVVGILRSLGVAGQSAAVGAEAASVSTASLGTRLARAATAAKNFGTGVGGSVLALGALAVAAYKTAEASNEWVDSLEAADKAQSALIDTQARAIRQDKQILELRKQSVDSIREQAKAIEDFADKRKLATNTLLEAQDAFEAAVAGGNQAEIDTAKQRLAEARSFRNEVDSFHAIEIQQIDERAKAQETGFAAARDAYLKFKVDFDRGTFDSQQKALASLQQIAGGLSGESLKQAQADIRKIQASVLAEELDNLKKRVEAEKVSSQESRAILNGLLSTYQANSDQRRKAQEGLTEALGKQLEKRLAREKQYASRTLELAKSAIQQRIQLAQDSPEIDALEERLEKGEDVLALIRREATQQTEKLQGLIDEEAALERIKIKREEAAAIKADPKGASTIEAQTAEQLRQLNVQTEREKQALQRETAAKVADLEEKAGKARLERAKKAAELEAEQASIALERFELERRAAQEAFDSRRQALAEEERLGRDVGQRRLDLEKEIQDFVRSRLQDQLKLEIQAIEAKREAVNEGATEEQRRLNDQRAQLDVLKAQQLVREQIRQIDDTSLSKARELTAELQKQISETKKLNAAKKRGQEGFDTSFGGVSSDASGFDDNFGRSNLPSGRESPDNSGPSLAELEARLKRQQIREIEAAEASGTNQRARQNPEGTDLTKAVNEALRNGQVQQSTVQPQAPQDSFNAANAQAAEQSAAAAQRQLSEHQRTNRLLQQLISGQRNPTENSGAPFARGRGGFPRS